MEKSHYPYSTETLTQTIHDLLTDFDDDTLNFQFGFQEELIEKVMQEFYNEMITCSPLLKPPSLTLTSLPYSLPPVEGKEGTAITEIGSLPVAELKDGNDDFDGEDKKMEKGFEDGDDLDFEWLRSVLNWDQVVDTNA